VGNHAANVLLITSDQQHWRTLGLINPELETPNLDRLAAGGTLFTRAYCPNPTCTPTRASMITGRYPSQHGAWALGTKLPESEATLGHHLAGVGYRTALVGKAHFQPLLGTETYPSLEAYPILQDLEFWRDFHGPFYGFEHVELARNHTDEAHIGQHYALWMEAQGCQNWREFFRPPTGTAPAQRWRWNLPEAYHYNAWIAERSNALLEGYSRTGQRFFLWASFFDPHPSYLVPAPWDSLYDPAGISVPRVHPGEHANNPPHFALTQQPDPDFSGYAEAGGNACHGFHSHLQDPKELAQDIAVYYGMISCMDKYVGRILDKLADLDLVEDTIVVFTSDHGHFFGQHGLIRKGPFHYEDMIRVPLIVRCPGLVPAGKRSNALQSLVDLAPTVLSLAGAATPRAMTGRNQSSVWLGERETVRDHVVVENRHQPTTVHLKTYIENRYKITVYYNQRYGELFDLQEDPEELNNRWDDPDYREVKSELLLRFLHAEMGKEPLWMPRVAVA
jgi:arylsulfatase A-like enzyme